MLRFIKGGNQFAIADGRHLGVSQGMMGARWLQEEWKPNTAELEFNVDFDERKFSNQERFLYRQWIFNEVLSAGCFNIINDFPLTFP